MKTDKNGGEKFLMKSLVAVNAKIKAMKPKLLTVNDYKKIFSSKEIPHLKSLEEDTLRILHYIHDRPLKMFMYSYAMGLKIRSKEHYMNLWQNVMDKQKSMKPIIGTEIDLQNILWIYRLKKFYGIYGEVTFGYLTPINYRLSNECLKHMVACKDVNSFLKELEKSQYNKVFDDFKNGELKIISKIKYEYSNKQEAIPLTCGYLFNKYIETKNLITIKQGLELQLNEEMIFSKLIY